MIDSKLNRLVVGISSRALFDLRLENEIYETLGLDAFRRHQRDHWNEILRPGGAFPLVRSLLGLTESRDERSVEVVLASKNHPDIVRRIFHSIEHYKLPIGIAALTGGDPVAPYLGGHGVNLFLSSDKTDVQQAINAGIAAGLIYDLPANVELPLDELRLAFDGDGVLFSDEADRVYRESGLDAYFEYERENAARPLPDGPFAPVLRLIRDLQSGGNPRLPIRVALVTARNIQAQERVLRTLDAWDVRLDEAHFLGRTPKARILSVFGPHIFFDDREEHCQAAAVRVPTARVLPADDQPDTSRLANKQMRLDAEPRKNRFLLTCKVFLGKGYGPNAEHLSQWFYDNLSPWPVEHAERLIDELEISAKNTPRGEQRRAAGKSNDKTTKLMTFLMQLAKKHRPV
jgi:5'-nucleotidase